jgi:ethanolamine utilization protein EutN
MFLGRVAGTVWSTVKWPEAKGLKLLLVRPYRLGDLPPGVAAAAPGVAAGVGGAASEPTDDLVVCADMLDAGPGDDVIVAFGHAARVALSEKLPPGSKPSVPIDAAVVAVVDRVEIAR